MPRHASILNVTGLVLAMGSLALAAKKPPPGGPAAPPQAWPPKMLADAQAGPLAGVDSVIFATRGVGSDGHWYANFGYHVTNDKQMMFGQPLGGRLCRLDLRTGKVSTIFDDPAGGVRDPQLSYDARKILFSYRKGPSRYYHLYEIDIDGANLRQITDGPRDDIEPIYLPCGDILFCSSRCNRWVQCWMVQVAVMYRCGPDGSNIHPISCNVEQDNTPWMMPDGRVLYMRWEYVDRSRVKFHHLWTANPDGTSAMVYFGNMHPGTVMLDAKPIPGTSKVVSVFSPGHGRKEHAGQLAIVDPDAGPDDLKWVRFISKSGDSRDPYPLTKDLFLAAEGSRIVLIDAQGRVEELARADGPGMWAHEPRPVVARPREPVIAPRTDYSQATGSLLLANVNHGRNMAGVEAGQIKKLLVLETLPKPVNFSGTMEPLSLGGTFTLERILGTVPVEPDGSAYFEVPALRPVFFVALDANNMSVKRMQSFVSVMPGETTSCAGCHENRTDTATPNPTSLAMRKPPAGIEPIAGVPDVIDFTRDVQPILDRNCTRCHSSRRNDPPPKLLSLDGDRGQWYSHSYAGLMLRGMVAHGRDAEGNLPPRSIGASASRLMKQLDGSHNDVKLTPLEYKTVRLWIETGATYPGTYAALGTGMTGKISPDRDTLQRRCASCHAGGKAGQAKAAAPRFRTDDELLCNLTAPARSFLLLAPLAKGAGGWGICKSDEAPNGVFASTDDPDYRKLLANVEGVRQNLQRITRFDMPDFRPNAPYVREMKRFGILPEAADPAQGRIDVYAADRAYWKSFWFQPEKAK